ncbi:MAG: peptidoglycan DD-metalloendopeptidase family protein [Solirubrobacterales bacterium]|nr:peptidoglycan DD-metalloendopeptidase family protein [Solirubrobacterales bacterium]
MLIRRRPLTHAACPLLAALVCAGAVALPGLRSTPARAASIGSLQQQISAGQGHISSLSGTVRAASGRVGGLDASIAALASRLARIQADLDAKRAELAKLRSELSTARVRLAQLEAYDAHAESVLAQQLVASYESDNPNVVTVVLSATGFSDLLERLTFMQRVRKQDIVIIGQVRAARRAEAAEATHLGKLEVRQQKLTAQVLADRNSLLQTSAGLERQRAAVARFRDAKASELANARDEVSRLQHQLSQLEAAQAALAASSSSSSGASSGGSLSPAIAPSSAPVSSGGFVFPLPKSAASSPGSWSPDQGVDISAPGNTPEYAVCSGTIVLHGIGGFGPWAPVLHCDGSLDGYSYVYYGHAGPLYQLAVGTHVGAGQVMSSIGPGIVGISTGPHLEIGFADSSGSPIGSGTAGTMLSLLQAAYNG